MSEDKAVRRSKSEKAEKAEKQVDKFEEVKTAEVEETKDEEVVETQAIPRSNLSKVLRFVGLLLVIPVIYLVPHILSWGANKVKENRTPIVVLWVFYALLLLAIFFKIKKNTITANSLFTQIITWAIFTLGAYNLVDIPRMIDVSLRRDVLWLWLSLTMVFNLIYFLVDDTNYQEAEEKERLREERKQRKEEERRKRREEKEKKKLDERKKKRDEKMGPVLKWIINSLIYVALLGFVAYLGYKVYLVNNQLQEELARQNEPIDPLRDEDYTGHYDEN
eukprot:TRINITY_DN3347_c0_g1_i2.p1 TRINITY_DN3347_c0_g1~~TRINITY_DN3347_c0_g1_i2.p1  ORF type:complete len:277 (-),score=69.68 TRINITY_DN3347_c0_g1_i2:40-870(-)